MEEKFFGEMNDIQKANFKKIMQESEVERKMEDIVISTEIIKIVYDSEEEC